jgi:hypothetical protein
MTFAQHLRLRADVLYELVDGDLVVFDPVPPACHVLGGGAVIVWDELLGDTTAGLVERIATRVGLAVSELYGQVAEVVAELQALDLLEPTEASSLAE